MHQNRVCSQPWWHGIGHDPISTDVVGEMTRSLSPSKISKDSLGSKTKKSEVEDGMDDRKDVNGKIEMAIFSQSDGKSGKEQQHAKSIMPQAMGEYLTPPTQLGILGHSIACASYQYPDPYYSGAMPTFRSQALVHSHCLGVHPDRMVLPLERAEEPVYVNAKQYHGILRRRQSRAKAELGKKLIKFRKPYLHESRHLHAMKRARGSGGRFLNTKHLAGNNSTTEPDKGTISLGTETAYSSDSMHSETSNFSRNVHPSSGLMEVAKIHAQVVLQPQSTYSTADGNSCYIYHQGLKFSSYHSLPGERTEEGESPAQQHERLMVHGAHRGLIIK